MGNTNKGTSSSNSVIILRFDSYKKNKLLNVVIRSPYENLQAIQETESKFYIVEDNKKLIEINSEIFEGNLQEYKNHITIKHILEPVESKSDPNDDSFKINTEASITELFCGIILTMNPYYISNIHMGNRSNRNVIHLRFIRSHLNYT